MVWATRNRWTESKDVIGLLMASDPFEMFGGETKSTPWETDTVFLQYQLSVTDVAKLLPARPHPLRL